MKRNQLLSLIYTLFLLFLYSKGISQTITGIPGKYTCVFAGNSCTYIISNYENGSDDKWCVLAGTINGDTDSCIMKCGTSTVNITWKSGYQAASISYYKNESDAEPTATLNVAILNAGAINAGNTIYNLPFIPSGIQVVIPLIGSDMNTCSEPMTYQWQKSDDGRTYTDINGASEKDYLVNDTFTNDVYFKRTVFPSSVPGTVIGESVIQFIVQH
jgi:hypothetical protein